MKLPFGRHLDLGLDLGLGLHMRIGGPWPFITFRSYTLGGRRIIWRSRQHRKGLERDARALEGTPVPFWQTRSYNWSTGAFFAVGAFLFMLGSALSLLPDAPALSQGINLTFFAGSIPFTIAGYLQLFQAANATRFEIAPSATPRPHRIALVGWHPGSAGWLSTFTQFLGTLAFNVNTLDAMIAPSAWEAQDLAVWLPDMVGSLLFLASGYLAFIETTGGYWGWKPRVLAWQIVFVNLVGCIAFMTAAMLAYVPPGPEAWWIPVAANIHLFIGAFGFFAGALLMMRESRLAEPG